MDAATLQLLGTILGAGGGGAAILAIINGIFKLASGASHRERMRNTNLEVQRVKAIEERVAAENDRDTKVSKAKEERDKEADKRREAEEHVAILQRQLILAGITPLERPDI